MIDSMNQKNQQNNKMKETISREIDKFINKIKRIREKPTLEIIYDLDTFSWGIFEKESEDGFRRNSTISSLKDSLKKIENYFCLLNSSVLPQSDESNYERNKNKKYKYDEKRWWIFCGSQKFKILLQFQVKDMIKECLTHFFQHFLQSKCGSIRIIFDPSFIDKIFEEVYNKEEYCLSHQSGSLC